MAVGKDTYDEVSNDKDNDCGGGVVHEVCAEEADAG
jgi:hypothetical protein